MVVSVASILAPYRYSPDALKIIIQTGSEYSVSSITMHNFFDKALINPLTGAPAPPATEQAFDCCFLNLNDKKLEKLPSDEIEALSSSLRYPLIFDQEGFRGTLLDIDLPLVLQTLNNAQRDGILYLCDDLMRPLAQIFCLKGRIVSATYQNLWNEMAIYQIIQKNLVTKFAFYPTKNQGTWPNALVNKPSETILLEAYRRLDELERIRSGLAVSLIAFGRTKPQCDSSRLSAEVKPFAQEIFQALDQITPADDLWMMLRCDDYIIYRTLFELSRSGQISALSSNSSSANIERNAHHLQGLSKANLDPQSSITNISIEPASMQMKEKTGAISSERNLQTGFFDHNINLPRSAAGTPILQSNEIVGMHCRSHALQDSANNSKMLALSDILVYQQDAEMVLKTYERPKKVAAKSKGNQTGARTGGNIALTATAVTPSKAASSIARKIIMNIIWFVGGFFVVLALFNLVSMLNAPPSPPQNLTR